MVDLGSTNAFSTSDRAVKSNSSKPMIEKVVDESIAVQSALPTPIVTPIRIIPTTQPRSILKNQPTAVKSRNSGKTNRLSWNSTSSNLTFDKEKEPNQIGLDAQAMQSTPVPLIYKDNLRKSKVRKSTF